MALFVRSIGFAAEALGLLEAFGVHVADDDDGRAEQMARSCAGEADRARRRRRRRSSPADAGGDGAVVAGGEDVGEQGEVFDLRHRLVFVGEFEQVEIGVGDHDVFGLAADPAAHVDVAVGAAGRGRDSR